MKTQPDTGARVGVLKAVPTKRALRNDARKLGVVDALAEIVDNSIDNFAKQQWLDRKADHLRIEIDMNEDQVTIREDSGGVTPEDLLAFVQVGARGELIDSPRIGVWGSGQKHAVAALGNDITISTRYWRKTDKIYEIDGTETDQLVIRMDERWWADDQDWDIPVHLPAHDLATGETHYEIRGLNRRIDEDTVNLVVKELQSQYGDMLVAETTTITVNNEKLQGEPRLTEEALNKLFAWPPGFEPSEHWFTLEKAVQEIEGGEYRNVDRKLKMRVIVGLTPKWDQKSAGVHMFGVPETESGHRLAPRRFADALQDESVGYGSGPRSYLRKGHPTLGRLQMYVVFHGDSEIIPWGLPGSPVKRGYNAANVFAEEIAERLKEVARPYARFTAKAREIDLIPYSAEWGKMSDVEKKAQLRRGAYLKDPADVEERDVAPKVRALLRHSSKPRPFRTWDHDKRPGEPPELVPAFDDKLSKAVVSDITERDRRLHEIKGNDPVEAVQVLMATLDSLKAKDEDGWTTAEEDDSRDQDRMIPVTVRLPRSQLTILARLAGTTNRSEALVRAVEFFIQKGGD